MHLSRLTLFLSHPVVARALGDLHTLHRLILQGFPDQADGGAGRVLFRIESPTGPQAPPTILVQSDNEPSWQSLSTLARIDGPKVWEPQFAAAQALRFRLRATPTVCKTFGEGATHPGKRRIGLYTEEEQRAWLERKASENGFLVDEVRVRPVGKLTGRKPDGTSLVHHGVDFDGVLRVTDATGFGEAIRSGIGPAKGFGFGLLSVAKA